MRKSGLSGNGPGIDNDCKKPMRLFSILDVAEQVAVSTRTVRRWIDDGLLVSTQIRGIIRIEDDDLRAFLTAHRR
jgi:excisionase family DNA binding protein